MVIQILGTGGSLLCQARVLVMVLVAVADGSSSRQGVAGQVRPLGLCYHLWLEYFSFAYKYSRSDDFWSISCLVSQ
jgi:hypothetical protein